ncbi:MAG TPA: hypothetical protein VGV17_15915 [Bosea sp. (in: a-proteobacteria)]|jgi:hypothetical protein|uniref:hypothetical protein n=1 Tax=Bosea sp. (in: a-proteobacteria) TaxID=1871050 RepID=UPI002DDCAFAD|nr:hypothetical protein [Bosea sp. (in: a-proteobacteria)]HEV2555241.1 hypothetical protein [Bosea sp. (in: a-proteobacteria)]
MSRDLAKRLVRLEARRAQAVERMSDEALIAAIMTAEARLKARLGEGWEADYRDHLAETQPHLLPAWMARRDTIRKLEARA